MNDGGLSSFQRRMRAIPKSAISALQPALVKSAEEIADVMRDLAPVAEGNLRMSIWVTGGGETTPAYSQPGGQSVVPLNAAAITVGHTKVRYAHLVEYGTDNAAAQPFFWPAYRLGKSKALARIKRSIGKAVKEAR